MWYEQKSASVQYDRGHSLTCRPGMPAESTILNIIKAPFEFHWDDPLLREWVCWRKPLFCYAGKIGTNRMVLYIKVAIPDGVGQPKHTGTPWRNFDSSCDVRWERSQHDMRWTTACRSEARPLVLRLVIEVRDSLGTDNPLERPDAKRETGEFRLVKSAGQLATRHGPTSRSFAQ